MSLYHPIGTIVKLTFDENMLFMIAGYLPRQGNGKIHDYFAVPFPFGLMKNNQYVIFNRDRITDVIHTGYCDDDCQEVLNGFDQFAENLKKAAQEETAEESS